MMSETQTTNVFKLRLLVGFLGERAQCGWWPTGFFEPTSRVFLDPVCSKTAYLAQYHGVLEAARRLHDEHLNVGSYHLFRLPEELEQDLHGIVRESNQEAIAQTLPGSKEEAMDSLRAMAPGDSAACVGPTAVGNIRDIHCPETIGAVASAYYSAFTQNAKTYPYLVS